MLNKAQSAINDSSLMSIRLLWETLAATHPLLGAKAVGGESPVQPPGKPSLRGHLQESPSRDSRRRPTATHEHSRRNSSRLVAVSIALRISRSLSTSVNDWIAGNTSEPSAPNLSFRHNLMP